VALEYAHRFGGACHHCRSTSTIVGYRNESPAASDRASMQDCPALLARSHDRRLFDAVIDRVAHQVKQGIGDASQLSVDQSLRLIFRPGFSTRPRLLMFRVVGGPGCC